MPSQIVFSGLDDPISIDEIELVIKHFSNQKTAGPDDIQASFIKNSQCINFLCIFFSKCFSSGLIPSALLKSIIHPIEKSGADSDSLNPSDYRGISLQSVVMKVFCAVLNNRLSDYLETNNLLVEEQNGFRQDRSCQDHLFTVYNLVESRQLSGLQTFACFIDFRKAFDSITREVLWKKLEHSVHIKGCFLNILIKMYENISIVLELMMFIPIGSPSTGASNRVVFYLLPCLICSLMTLCRIFRPLT